MGDHPGLPGPYPPNKGVVSGAITGTYSVNADCTGSVSVSFETKKFTSNFVIVNGDKSALEISTESGDITTTTVAKQ